MRLPPMARGIHRSSPIPSRATLAHGAVEPSLTGKCYDNHDCENSIWPGRGKKVLDDSTVTQCYNSVGGQGAWKAAIRGTDVECYRLDTNYAGLKQREQLRRDNFFS